MEAGTETRKMTIVGAKVDAGAGGQVLGTKKVCPDLGTKKGRPAEAERESVAQLRERWADAIEKAVADAPPLSQERLDGLAGLFTAKRL